MPTLMDFFNQFLPVIEDDLRFVLAGPDDAPPLYHRMLHYHMGWVDADGNNLPGESGKRIRPMLTMLVCQAVCGDHTAARPAASAVELLHNFSLLHDDIQDQSPTRRNRPAVWTVWGTNQAINAGDVMFTLAHLAIPRLSNKLDRSHSIAEQIVELDEACLELTRGQHLDMLFEKQAQVSTDDYLNMIAGKTAALLASSARLGAIAGQAKQEQQQHFRDFGYNLGMAFQVRDDILDIWGDPEVIGKRAAIDIHQRKKSLPVLYALSQDPDLIDVYSQSEDFDEQQVSDVVDRMTEVGARSFAEAVAADFSDKTISSLEKAAPIGDVGDALLHLVDLLYRRDH